MNEKINNTDIPTSMKLPRDVSLSKDSKHIRKEIENKLKLLFRGEKLHKAITERELKKPSRW